MRVFTRTESVPCAVDKEFSLCDNYPKGHGELLCEWVENHQYGSLLLHVKRVSGSCQDLDVEG